MKKEFGFSLLELVIVLAIASVVALIAIPAYDVLMQKMESWRVKRYVKESLRQGRMEALSRHKDVIVCAVNDGNLCDKQNQKAMWVFVDTNYNYRFDASDVLVYNQALDLKYGNLYIETSRSQGHIRYTGDTAKPRGNFGRIKYCNFSGRSIYDFHIAISHFGHISEKLDGSSKC